MAIYRGVNGVNRQITQIFRGLNSTNRIIISEYEGINGVNKEIFTGKYSGRDIKEIKLEVYYRYVAMNNGTVTPSKTSKSISSSTISVSSYDYYTKLIYDVRYAGGYKIIMKDGRVLSESSHSLDRLKAILPNFYVNCTVNAESSSSSSDGAGGANILGQNNPDGSWYSPYSKSTTHYFSNKQQSKVFLNISARGGSDGGTISASITLNSAYADGYSIPISFVDKGQYTGS